MQERTKETITIEIDESMFLPNGDEPCYVISVAAQMVNLHPQTLRRYEQMGLIQPARVSGKRLYSPNDIERLRTITTLVDELGVNVAGVQVILHLVDRIRELQSEMEHMCAQHAREMERLQQLLSQLQ